MALLAQAIGICSATASIKQTFFCQNADAFFSRRIVWTALMLNAGFKTIVYHDTVRGWPAMLLFFFRLGHCSVKYFGRNSNAGATFLSENVTVTFGFKADVLGVPGLINTALCS